MKRRLFLCVITMITLITAGWANFPVVQASSAVDAIKEAGILRIGTSADYPPYQWIVNVDGKDEIVGFEIDIAHDIADALGVELEVVDMNFDGVLPALAAGKVDLAVAGFTPTPERAQSVDFSERVRDYVGKHYLLILDKNKDHWTSQDQIEEMTIAVQKGTIQEEWLIDTYPKAKLQSVPKQTDGLLALTSGRADGLFVAGIVADVYIEHQPSIIISDISMDGLPHEASAFAVNKGREDLVEVVDQVISELKQSGQIEKYIQEATKLMIETE